MRQKILKKGFATAMLRAGVWGMSLVLPMAGWGQTTFDVSKKVDRMVLVAQPKNKNVMKEFGYRGPPLPTLTKPSNGQYLTDAE